MMRVFTLKKKILTDGHDLRLVKYYTDHPKSMSAITKAGWLPEFDGSYEMILGLDKNGKRLYHHNTHPKLSWYLDVSSFKKLFDLINHSKDFSTVDRLLANYFKEYMNHVEVRRQVTGLLTLLEPPK